jgi:AAA domain
MLATLGNFLKNFLPRPGVQLVHNDAPPRRPLLQPLGLDDFLNLDIPPRQMLLSPILPERSLAMLYAPRGVGKTLLGLSIGLAIASGNPLLRWSTPHPRRVLYVDGEMPLVSLQERLRAISLGLSGEVLNAGFRILAADHVESGINLGSEEGQRALDPLLEDVDLLILDNLSTLCTTGGESASDAWVPMQNWLLMLRRRGIAVLFIHHAGTNGRQRGTSRREDALDTVIALRRPEDYSLEQGARFEIHFEKLRIERMVLEPFRSRRASSHSPPMDAMASAGVHVISYPQFSNGRLHFSPMDLRFGRWRRSLASARVRLGAFGSKPWTMDCFQETKLRRTTTPRFNVTPSACCPVSQSL